MVEIYCFINPIDVYSIEQTEALYHIIQQQSKKYKFHVVPVANFRLINNYLTTVHPCKHSLRYHNQVMNLLYNIALDFEALATVNRYKASLYLKEIAFALHEGKNYTDELVHQIVKDLALSVDTFERRRTLPITKERVQQNQELVQEMKVSTLPSYVVFDFSHDEDCGVILRQKEDLQVIERILEQGSVAYSI